MMKASIIIPTKNAGVQFKGVLQALLEQKTPWEYEILVVDSGSSDGTVQYVLDQKRVRLHQIPAKEFGHGATRNLGISLTSGEFAVMITHDALPAGNTWLLELVTAADQDENIAGSFGRHIAYEHDGPFLKRDLHQHFNGFLEWPDVVYMKDKERYKFDLGYQQFLHFFSDNNACLRRSVWEKIPYPEVDFAEDQIIEAGYAKAYTDKAVVYHSHTFDFIELCQRSFDEARALQRLFGYELCPTVIQMLGQSLRTTVNDIRYLKEKGMMLGNLVWILRAPFRNTAKQVGYYLGQRANRLPDAMVRYISRDMALKRK